MSIASPFGTTALGSRPVVSPRARVISVVSAIAVLAVAAVVVLALSQRDDPALRGVSTQARNERPALELAVIDRDDAQARGLRQAERLYEEDKPAEARTAFESLARTDPDSVEAAVGSAVAGWPDGTLDELEAIAEAHPGNGVALLNLGLAQLAAGDVGAAQGSWREAKQRDPDSPAALRAEDLLNPHSPPGRPQFLVEDVPRRLVRMSLDERLTTLRRAAEGGGDARDWILYGSALETIGHRESARRAYDRAVEADPDSLEASVASVVARFDKDDPSAAFSRLGPLAAKHPKSALVRFHLGLMLLWLPDLDGARKQLERATENDPAGFYGGQAARVLQRLDAVQ
jgi:tetratricopeptide (TPR) repeat protein